jgi:hypothetical protein
VRNGGELDEVFVANVVFGEHELMVFGPLFLLGDVTVNDVHLIANDGLDAFSFTYLQQLNRAVHDAVIGEGDRIHPQFQGPIHQRIDMASTIEQAVVAVDVQTNKSHKNTPENALTKDIYARQDDKIAKDSTNLLLKRKRFNHTSYTNKL